MAAAQCITCGDLLRYRPDQIEVRVEYRAATDQARLRTWRVAMLCHPCAEREYAARDGIVAPAPLPAPAGALVIDDPDRLLTLDEVADYLAELFPGIAPLDDAASIAAQVAARAPANRPAGVGPCGRCGAALRTTTAIELRREYRQVGTLARLRTWRESWRCRTCADAEADEHDHPHGRVNEQAVLL